MLTRPLQAVGALPLCRISLRDGQQAYDPPHRPRAGVTTTSTISEFPMPLGLSRNRAIWPARLPSKAPGRASARRWPQGLQVLA